MLITGLLGMVMFASVLGYEKSLDLVNILNTRGLTQLTLRAFTLLANL